MSSLEKCLDRPPRKRNLAAKPIVTNSHKYSWAWLNSLVTTGTQIVPCKTLAALGNFDGRTNLCDRLVRTISGGW